MPKGQFGARHVQKHLWRLNIPAYDPAKTIHADLAALGDKATKRGHKRLNMLRAERATRNQKTTAIVARRELREWLSASKTGRRIDKLVERLNL